eukprot:TRINITY_DN15880_c0_g3_i1.p1 TRINITY_DN15880_c0_g3~~TRINITY_DN15880_c0_g3_i1.p1  ORF type:complete len:102 (-),score=16.14 TRINITY_DN15880_c0_g3_i1:75-380(-)
MTTWVRTSPSLSLSLSDPCARLTFTLTISPSASTGILNGTEIPEHQRQFLKAFAAEKKKKGTGGGRAGKGASSSGTGRGGAGPDLGGGALQSGGLSLGKRA